MIHKREGRKSKLHSYLALARIRLGSEWATSGRKSRFGPSTSCTRFAAYTGKTECLGYWLPPYLYLNKPHTTWSKRFVFIFGVELLKSYLCYYLLAGSSSVPVMDALVEGPPLIGNLCMPNHFGHVTWNTMMEVVSLLSWWEGETMVHSQCREGKQRLGRVEEQILSRILPYIWNHFPMTRDSQLPIKREGNIRCSLG
jgi:hypothetical protein